MFQEKVSFRRRRNSSSMDLNNSLGNTIRHNTTNKQEQPENRHMYAYHFENDYSTFLLEIVCIKILTEAFSWKCLIWEGGVCESYVWQYGGGITDKGIHTYINTIVTHATRMLAIDLLFLNHFKSYPTMSNHIESSKIL